MQETNNTLSWLSYDSKSTDIATSTYEHLASLLQRQPRRVHWFRLRSTSMEELEPLLEALSLPGFVGSWFRQSNRRTRTVVLEEMLLLKTGFPIPEEDGGLEMRSVSLLLKGNVLLSLEEEAMESWTILEEKIKTGTGRIRKQQADFLLHAMLETILHYLQGLEESTEETVARLETALVNSTGIYDALQEGFEARNHLQSLQRFSRSFRDALQTLQLNEHSHLVRPSVRPWFQHLQQLSQALVEGFESQFDQLKGLMELHYASTNRQMSEVMKVLAIISTIFIPLNLIAAIYGMNFVWMPELKIKGMYYGVLGGMAVLAGSMLLYFKSRKWL